MYMNPILKKAVCLLLVLTFASVVTLWDARPAEAGFVKSIGKAISGAVKGIGKAIGGVVNGVKSFVSSAASFVKDKLVPVLAKIAPIVGLVASVVAPYLAPAFAGIVSAIGTGAKIASSISTLIQSKGKNLLGAITGLAGSFGGPIGGIIDKVGGIAGKISEGLGMVKSGNFGGLLGMVGGALTGGKLDGVGQFLTGLGADTLAKGNGITGLLGAVGGKIMGTDIAKNLLGGASSLIGGLQDKATGILGNFKGIVGNVAGMLKSGAEGQASGILGSLGGILNKTGFVKDGGGFIDALAGKLTGVIDKGIAAVKNFSPAGLVEKYLPSVAAKIKEKLGVSAFDARIGKLQGFFGNVQQFAVAAQTGQGNIPAMFANAQALMQRTGPDTMLSELLGQVDFEAIKLQFKKDVVSKIEDKRARKLAEDAVNKLPNDMKLKQELRDLVKDILR